MELTEYQYRYVALFLPVLWKDACFEPAGARCHPVCYGAWLQVEKRPSRFGRWHTIRSRMNHQSRSGVPDRVFEHPREEPSVRIGQEAMSMDATIAEAHPDGIGAQKQSAGHR